MHRRTAGIVLLKDGAPVGPTGKITARRSCDHASPGSRFRTAEPLVRAAWRRNIGAATARTAAQSVPCSDTLDVLAPAVAAGAACTRPDAAARPTRGRSPNNASRASIVVPDTT